MDLSLAIRHVNEPLVMGILRGAELEELAQAAIRRDRTHDAVIGNAGVRADLDASPNQRIRFHNYKGTPIRVKAIRRPPSPPLRRHHTIVAAIPSPPAASAINAATATMHRRHPAKAPA